MPSPIGHTLIGLTISSLPLKSRIYQSCFWFAFVVFAANAPDLDFIPGWLMGDFNRYHHGVSHSLGAAVFFAGIFAFIARYTRYQPKMVFLIFLLSYLSHLLADYFAVDRVAPYGAPFLWPFSNQYYLSSFQIFYPIQHGNTGEGIAMVIDRIFSTENLMAIAIEFLIVTPVLAITFWCSRKR